MSIFRSAAKRPFVEYPPRSIWEILDENTGWVGIGRGLEEFLEKSAEQLEGRGYEYSSDNPPVRPDYIKNWITVCCFKQIYNFQKYGVAPCDCFLDVVRGRSTDIHCPACNRCSFCSKKGKTRECREINCYLAKNVNLRHLLVRR